MPWPNFIFLLITPENTRGRSLNKKSLVLFDGTKDESSIKLDAINSDSKVNRP
jgi:hypothetical protein